MEVIQSYRLARSTLDNFHKKVFIGCKVANSAMLVLLIFKEIDRYALDSFRNPDFGKCGREK